MPPKRKAPAKAAAGKTSTAKKAKPGAQKKQEEADNRPTLQKAVSALKKTGSFKKKTHTPDKRIPSSQLYEVVEDYDCMLNQTNIQHNNNKFYIIQCLKQKGFEQYHTFNCWGRVGENGANSFMKFGSKDQAIADFTKKFSAKTGNKWENRDKFSPKNGKYTLIEMGEDDGTPEPQMPSTSAVKDAVNKKVKPSKLSKQTQDLIKLIFDNDMFKEAMHDLNIDVKKMPLGKLSKTQIIKGFEVLEELQQAIQAKKPNNTLMSITSKFYTVIPHNFGRQRPPVIANAETLQAKLDLLGVLGDIELAQSIQKDKDKAFDKSEEVPHPYDVNYDLLKCDLTVVDPKSEERKMIDKYLAQTSQSSWRKVTLLDCFKVNRHDEGSKFKAHDGLQQRRLLWHGTNIAVVTAILKSGLRIMPHSGGRVGRGIYFASECSKSAGYVRPATSSRIGIMFLNEVALGQMKEIKMDDSSLRCPPAGYDSVVARGRVEPDPKADAHLVIDSHKVVIPQGQPVNQPKWQNSSFSQSEYLIYKENQCRIRYLLKMKFN